MYLTVTIIGNNLKILGIKKINAMSVKRIFIIKLSILILVVCKILKFKKLANQKIYDILLVKELDCS